jgi:hypothetical protein
VWDDLTGSCAFYLPFSAIKRVLIPTQESLPIFLFVLILAPIILAVSVVRVFIRVVLLGTIVLPVPQVLLPGTEPIAVTCIKRDVAVVPVGVALRIAIAAGNPVRIVGITLQAINI